MNVATIQEVYVFSLYLISCHMGWPKWLSGVNIIRVIVEVAIASRRKKGGFRTAFFFVIYYNAYNFVHILFPLKTFPSHALTLTVALQPVDVYTYSTRTPPLSKLLDLPLYNCNKCNLIAFLGTET